MVGVDVGRPAAAAAADAAALTAANPAKEDAFITGWFEDGPPGPLVKGVPVCPLSGWPGGGGKCGGSPPPARI